MKTVIEPADIKLNNHHERGDVAIWVPLPNSEYFQMCSHCNAQIYSNPTYYCPNCGSLMMNVVDAMARYENMIADIANTTKEVAK